MADPLNSPSVKAWEPHINAFVEFVEASDDQWLEDEAAHRLSFTVGVKDIIDVAGAPTRNGSRACLDAAPAMADADVVAALRKAGCQIVGKTTTTEFAFTDPTNCRNPHDLRRTPGGSSSGSGAAVAAGLVDIALGTQTAGSLIRPAAYCGAVGFKPTFGALSTVGVTPLAPSFDTVGVIARSVDNAAISFATMTGEGVDLSIKQSPSKALSGLLDTDATPASYCLDALHDASDRLQSLGGSVDRIVVPADIAKIVRNHRTVMNHEAGQAHQALLAADRIHLLQPKFRAGLEAGAKISAAEAEDAKAMLAEARRDFWECVGDVDTILTLPAPDGAPLLDGTTGFQDWLTPWTVFGGPLIALPWGLDTLGRPRSVMLAGRLGRDAGLLRQAKTLEALAPEAPRPTLPVGEAGR